MSESNRFFNEKTCPQCGKVFTIPHVTRWAYKKHTGKSMKYFCCWTCLRNAEIKKGGSKVKDQDKQRIRMSPAEMQTAIEMFRNGDKGLDQFLKDHGITSIYKWKYNVKTRYGIETPEPATVQVDGPIRIETKEPEKIFVGALKEGKPENIGELERVYPPAEELFPKFEHRITGIETQIGDFQYFRKTGYLDWTPVDIDETISMTVAEWKNLLKLLPLIAERLGVEL